MSEEITIRWRVVLDWRANNSTMSSDGEIPVLDPAQLGRIESTHRGFLYQHLFTAGCLLLAPAHHVVDITPERHEDVEIRIADRRVYCQVKTRKEHLAPADVRESLERFEKLRAAHATHDSGVNPEFWIISNSPPSPALAQQVATPKWPTDVRLSYPGSTAPRPTYLPPPWRDITEAVRWCSSIADAIPAARLSGETLTWKLAALVQHACTGPEERPHHRFVVADLPRLFEQLNVQLQRFPARPVPFRAMQAEPAFHTPQRVRMVVGLSGAGKTAWAAQASLHTSESVAYFDVAEMPEAAVPFALVRELAARFGLVGEALSTALAPGLAGLDSLRACDMALGRLEGPGRTVVLDNSHRLSAASLVSIIGATSSLRWLLLAQPSDQMSKIAASLSIDVEALNGFTLDSIAAEFHDRGLAIDAPTAERVRLLTGGLPLFVRQSTTLAARDYGGDAAAMCADLSARTHVSRTVQEQILADVLTRLPAPAQHAAAIVALSDVPLSADEARTMVVAALNLTPANAAQLLRDLDGAGVLNKVGSSLAMHDSFRLGASGLVSGLPNGAESRALRALTDAIIASIKGDWDFNRQSFLLRLLPQVGDIQTLVDIATSNDEQFVEYGYVPLVVPLLEKAVASTTLPTKERFWAQDTLLYWDLQAENDASARARLPVLERLFAESGGDDPKQLGALLVKKILWAGRMKDAPAARSAFLQAVECYDGDPTTLRILRYDLAVAVFRSGEHREAEKVTADLVKEYYDVLGLRFEDVLGASQQTIAARLRMDDQDVVSNLKRLADTLMFRAIVLNRMGQSAVFARMHAHKFFLMAHAVTSAVKIGQDVVDELVGFRDYEGALEFLDGGVLAVVERFRLLAHLVPVRAQRAVVLAYLGRREDALAEIARLKQFAAADSQQMAELKNQERLLLEILRNPPPSFANPMERSRSTAPPTNMPRKVGRNEACPCGSTKKFKRCCGA